MLFSDEYFMRLALKEAAYALEEDEVPVGAIVVCNNKIIGKGYNQTERLKDVTAHAEMLAITAASNYLGAKFLEECALYVTLEPCLMCASALKWVRISKLVYGAADAKAGFSLITSSVLHTKRGAEHLLQKEKGNGKDSFQILHPKTKVVKGVLENECGTLMTKFFRAKRS